MPGPNVMHLLDIFLPSAKPQHLMEYFMRDGGAVLFCKKQGVIRIPWPLPEDHSKVFCMIPLTGAVSPQRLEVGQIEMVDVFAALLVITDQGMGVKPLQNASRLCDQLIAPNGIVPSKLFLDPVPVKLRHLLDILEFRPSFLAILLPYYKNKV